MSQVSLRETEELVSGRKGPPLVSIFLPVFNEEGNIERLHSRIIEAVEPLGFGFEVIYVDDGSSDKSLQLLSRIAAADARARVISFPPELRADGGDGCRHPRFTGSNTYPDGCRHAERSG